MTAAPRPSLPHGRFWTGALRTATFRLAVAFSGAFTLLTLLLFAFIYWQTAIYETERIDRFIVGEAQHLAAAPRQELAQAVDTRFASDLRRVTFAALFAPDGHPIRGDLARWPDGLVADGLPHSVDVTLLAPPGRLELVHAVAARRADGDTLVIGRNIDELVMLRKIVARALLLGLIPAATLSLGIGAWLSLRTTGRLRRIYQAVERIMRGDLHERLPTRGVRDDLDRLIEGVNRMLDEIERLVGEVRGIGDDIAHDLRTPLARVRTRLERGRRNARGAEELGTVVDKAIADLDKALAVVTALLRIGEIEGGRRRAGFGMVSLADIALEVSELYQPIAEEKDLTLSTEAAAVPEVIGDRDLLMEAVANLVDNAIKFTPAGGEVGIAVLATPDGPVLRVRDTGPGIAPDERPKVLRRLYRSDRSRHVEGNGLGLSLVAAIAGLHDYRLRIGDAAPGAVFELVCRAHGPPVP